MALAFHRSFRPIMRQIFTKTHPTTLTAPAAPTTPAAPTMMAMAVIAQQKCTLTSYARAQNHEQNKNDSVKKNTLDENSNSSAHHMTRKTQNAFVPYHSVVITLAGPDRTGIVHELTHYLHTEKANVEESRMTVLGNDFAVILLVQVPQTLSPENLEQSLHEQFGDFVVTARNTYPSGMPFGQQPVRILRMAVQGPDQPGVVRAITEFLYKHGASIRDLDTNTNSAPFAGYKIFNMRCVLALPLSVEPATFMQSVQDFESTYNFDVEVRDALQEGEGEDEDGGGDENDELDNLDQDPEQQSEDPPSRSDMAAKSSDGKPNKEELAAQYAAIAQRLAAKRAAAAKSGSTPSTPNSNVRK